MSSANFSLHPNVVLMLAYVVDHSPIVFPIDDPTTPGLIFKVDPSIELAGQLIAGVLDRLKLDSRNSKIKIVTEYRDEILLANGEPASFFVGTLKSSIPIPVGWLTMPQILKSMPADRKRITYIKALQVLAGGLEEQTCAIDAREALELLKSDD